MADITDPQAIAFVNQQCRPLAEAARKFAAEVAAFETQWFAGLNALITNSASDDIIDNREAEGISRLTGADIHSLAGVLINMEAQKNDQIISKPCVRQLRVNG